MKKQIAAVLVFVALAGVPLFAQTIDASTVKISHSEETTKRGYENEMIDFNFKELDIPTNVILLPEKPYQLFVSILMPEIKDDRIGSYNMNDKYLIKEHIAFIVAYNYAKAISKVHVDNVILTMNYLAHNLVIVYIVNKDIVTIYYSRGEGL